MTDDPFVLPELPSESRVELVTSTVLTIAKLMSGAGLGIGSFLIAIPSEKMSAIVTLMIFGLGVVGAVISWLGSRWQHYRMAVTAKNAEVSAAVVSANLSAASGVPTPVTVQITPTGQPNIAVPVTTQGSAIVTDPIV
jgi:hypothetical protein